MPYKIEYKKDEQRPYKIINIDRNQVVGSSLTLQDAQATIRARLVGEHKKL